MNYKKDLGILIMRVGLGLSFMIHGWPKIAGGQEKWEELGGAMANIGIPFFPIFWGFMAAISEFFGGLFLVVGVLHIPSLIALFLTMIIAMVYHIQADHTYSRISHPLELAVVFSALLFTGTGRFSLKFMLNKKDN